MSQDKLIVELAHALAEKLSPKFSPDIELWNIQRIADYFDKAVPVVKRSIISKSSFPRAVVTAKGARPLYFANEVVKWAKSMQQDD